ncbi:MAG: redoxin domain-containing protein [Planctomycetes bacterium]|nr:redoxin domain-containing protein [Planctomycetota bacterium]
MHASRLLLATLCLLSLALAQDTERPKAGAPVQGLVFKDTRYSPRTLAEFGPKRAFVLLFVTDSCPIAKRYLPEIKRLHALYSKRGVQFLVVSADPDRDIGRMAAFALSHDLPMPIVKDTGGRAARALGVTRTPEVALLDAKLVLRYRGRIDDQVKFGGLRPGRLRERGSGRGHDRGGRRRASDASLVRGARRQGVQQPPRPLGRRAAPDRGLGSLGHAQRRRDEDPPLQAFPKSKWSIGKPDLEIRMRRPIKVRADGYMPYQYVMLKHRFDQDTWVEKLEIVGDNPEVLHHCNVFFLRPGKAFDSSQIVAGKVPGGSPLDLGPGVATLIPKGALLGLQIHYQPNGTAVEDRISIGLVFPKAPVQKRFRAATIENRTFAIPPGAPHHRVTASYTFAETVISGGLFAHMHVRGKDVTFRATYPDGRAETLLRVPNYSFDWQTAYAFKTPKRFPKGTRIDCVAHFDNSKFNPFNPDPSKTVRYGLQTNEEMMYCFAFYVKETEALGIRVDPNTGVALR